MLWEQHIAVHEVRRCLTATALISRSILSNYSATLLAVSAVVMLRCVWSTTESGHTALHSSRYRIWQHTIIVSTIHKSDTSDVISCKNINDFIQKKLFAISTRSITAACQHCSMFQAIYLRSTHFWLKLKFHVNLIQYPIKNTRSFKENVASTIDYTRILLAYICSTYWPAS